MSTLKRNNREIKAEPLTYTIYIGKYENEEFHYRDRSTVEMAMTAGIITSYESKEVTAIEHMQLFGSLPTA